MTKPIHSLIKQIDRKIELLTLKRDKLIIDTVNACQHPIDNIFRYDKTDGAPWIVCDLCGLAEEEWYCGCTKFRKHEYSEKIKEIDYEAFLEKRLLAMRNDQHINYKGKIPYDVLFI